MITAKSREYLAAARACSLAGDTEEWRSNMRRWANETRQIIAALPRAEDLSDEQLARFQSHE